MFLLSKGIEVKFKDQYYPVFINAKHIHQLNGLEVSDTGVHIGAAVTLSRLSFFLTKQIKEQEGNAKQEINVNNESIPTIIVENSGACETLCLRWVSLRILTEANSLQM